jgi:hypothetical protein
MRAKRVRLPDYPEYRYFQAWSYMYMNFEPTGIVNQWQHKVRQAYDGTVYQGFFKT